MPQLSAWGKTKKTQRLTALRGAFAVTIAALALIFTIADPRIAEAKYAAIVVDAGTGVVRHEANADDRNSPASLTKLMTIYLLFEAIENKRLSWNSPLTTSRHAANQSPTHLALSPGESILAKDAALALIIHSANDVAVVVAEALGETEEKFALMMTAKARKIGMTRTTFRNASGLPNPGQQSTARDMAILAQAMMDRFPQYYPMFAESSFVYKGRTFKSHNRVTLNYQGADGLKTGYTHASGFNLVTSATRDGRRLIGVVFGGNTAAARDQQMMRLLDDAFGGRHGGALIARNNLPNTQSKSKASARVQNATAQAEAPKPAAKAKRKPAQGDDEIVLVNPSLNNPDDKSDWGIQVGAFNTKSPAETTARGVSQKYAKLLKGGHVNIAPLANKKGKTLYRARIMGIDKDAAYETCKLLKRAQQPCMELRGSEDQEVAERVSTVR
jgi:D-alanyl-D-alanine carboxypeptidase